MRIPIREGLFTTADDPGSPRLLGGRCQGCGRFHFPVQAICPYCSDDGCESVTLSPRGTLYLCTTIKNRPPGYEGQVPFGFGVVELPEGIRIVARITDPDRPPGSPVRLVTERLYIDAEGRDVVSYAFAPGL